VTFVVSSSRGDIWLVLDHNDLLVESDETNNRQQVTIGAPDPVEEGSSDDRASDFTDMTLILLILALIVAGLIIAVLLVKKRRSTQAEKERDGEAPDGPALIPEVEGVAVSGHTPKVLVPKPMTDITGTQLGGAAPASQPQPLAGPAVIQAKPMASPAGPIPAALSGAGGLMALPPAMAVPIEAGNVAIAGVGEGTAAAVGTNE
jgi:hypothetical protein